MEKKPWKENEKTLEKKKGKMNLSKVTKTQWLILFFNILYLLVFSFLYLKRGNYEFLLYIGVVIFFIFLVAILHLKYRFDNDVLIGLSIWGLLHMSGGYFIINNDVLYAYWLLPFLRFDMFVHFFGFGAATLFSYYILKPNLNKNYSKIEISVLLVLIGMGLGALNEIIEFIAVLTVPETGVGGYYNTALDLVFNMLGAIAAVIYLKIKYHNNLYKF